MFSFRPFLPACFLLPLLWSAARSPVPEQTDSQEEASPMNRFKNSERDRLDREVGGAWNLVAYRVKGIDVDPKDIRGFALFSEGFLTLQMRFRELGQGFLTSQEVHHLQAAAYRYRVTPSLRLQTAGFQGFTNANPSGTLDYATPLIPREYGMQIRDDHLVLQGTGDTRLDFTRMPPAEFPAEAIKRINQERGAPGR